jgi:4,5-DOPA dioxygenase extradiol
MDRRTFLETLATGALAGLAACQAGLSRAAGRATDAAVAEPAPAAAAEGPPPPAKPRLPTAFVGHGSPETALDATKGGLWTQWSDRMPRPTAVLVVSAHWERAPITIGATESVPLIYDFSGFDRPLYEVRYAPPGAAALADRVEALLRPRNAVRRAPDRGLDHGAWVPLKWMYPRADVPVLPLSLPTQEPGALLRMGRELAPLREEGVLLLGSGNVVHNLGELDWAGNSPPPSWAAEFDAWAAEVLSRGDLDALAEYARKAPAARRAHPTREHFVPLLVVAGAGFERGGRATFPVTGFEAGSISRRCVQVG